MQASVAQAQSHLGATIVFVDVDPNTLCIDPDDLERQIIAAKAGGKVVRCAVVVHLAGHPCDMDRHVGAGRIVVFYYATK